jgi:tryptophanyl-tRNA synthetase
LREGAARLRQTYAIPMMARLRDAVGLRDLSRMTGTDEAAKGRAKKGGDVPSFKQYREADGKFYFKLVVGDRVLLQSVGFESPREAGQRLAALKQGEVGDAASDFRLGEGVTSDEVNAALAAFVAAALAEGSAGAG